MALKVSSDGQLVFFTKVFGATHAVTTKAKALLGAGVTFEVSLYNIVAQIKGTVTSTQITLTAGTSALMKGTVEPVVVGHNKNLIEGWLTALYQKLGSPVAAEAPQSFVSTKVILTGVEYSSAPAGTVNSKGKLVLIKAVIAATGQGLLNAKTLVEQAEKGTEVVVGSFPSTQAAFKVGQAIKDAGGKVELQPAGKPFFTPVKPVTGGLTIPPSKPVAEVIKLKDAQALGQKVHGTSSGSVYHTIALSEHVKVAARLSAGGSVSIRAEWTDNPTAELKKLEEAGVHMKSGYGSIHFDAANVPVQRVIGAFLVGTGISWKAAVMNGADLVVGA